MMNNGRALVKTAVLILTLFGVSSGSNPTTFETDLDMDGTVENIELDSSKQFALRVSRGGMLLWQAVPVSWKPWKLMIADVDGDGKREMIVGLFKSTKFFPRPHNCLFVYGWSGEKGFPKWLGSSLARPFTDFGFARAGDFPGDELVAVERTLDGKRALAIYHWNSFGFTKFREFGPWKSAELVRIEENMLDLDADGERVTFELDVDGGNKL